MSERDDDAKRGEELIKAQRAQGEPGEKQPPPQDTRVQADEAVKAIQEVEEKYSAPTYASADERQKQHGNLNPTPPEERTISRGPATTAPVDAAAGHLAAARTAITQHLESEARLKSDPRYERDQKIYEMGQAGTLPLVPPSEAEVAARAERAGVSAEVAEKIPTTPQEQVADDMARLEKAKEIQQEINPTVALANQQGEDRTQQTTDEGKSNNFTVK